MKKKIIIGIISVFILFMISIFIPVKTGEEWFNDAPIADVGHYEKCYYNIYGGRIIPFIFFD